MQSEHVYVFAQDHCTNCQRDEDESCPILASAFVAWPAEWQKTRCAAHWPVGESEPAQQCTDTLAKEP